MNFWYCAKIIAVTGMVTIGLRAFPFILFGGRRTPPAIIGYLGRMISPAAIAMLIVYCFCMEYKNTSFSGGGYGLAEAAATAAVTALHLWRKNPLLSICAGTALYMFIRQYCL